MTPEEYLAFLAIHIKASSLTEGEKKVLFAKLEEGTFTDSDLDRILEDLKKRERIVEDAKTALLSDASSAQ